jgi:ubiquinone/menaquinone biosynthesis C-methylase UbiE
MGFSVKLCDLCGCCFLMKRVVIPELLDTDSGTSEEIALSFLDLRGFNKNFGGVATMQHMIERVSRKTRINSFTLLEVASGAGYVPETVRQLVLGSGIHLQITLLDRALSHLPAQSVKNEIAGNGHAPASAVVADAMALPFQDASFDLIDCSLFAHHLSPDELAKFVNEALRVCRVAVLINDLIRHPLHLGLVYAASPLFRSRITRHDAPASVRAAYTPHEMRGLLPLTNAASIEIQRHYLFRMGVIVWKH